MKSSLLTGSLIAIAAPFLASAQCVGPNTPANLLVGQTWAFRIVGANLPVENAATLNIPQAAAVGTFTALPNGILDVVITNHETQGSTRNLITRLAMGQGRWSVNQFCNSGVIFINKLGSGPVSYQLDFILFDGGTQMFLSGADGSQGLSTGYPLTGSARRDPPRACPHGQTPTSVLGGMTYNYFGGGGGTSETGSFTGINAGSYGLLSIANRTIRQVYPAQLPGTEPILDQIGASGRYIIYPDCSGGELMFMNRTHPVQFEFVFSKSDFSEMYLVNDDLQPYPVAAIARKQ